MEETTSREECHTDTRYVTFTNGMKILTDAKRDIQNFDLQVLIHNLDNPSVNALRLNLKKSFVDALSLLCGLYVSDETPAGFDDSIINIFKATYESPEYQHIIVSIIEKSNGGSVFEEMLRIVKNDKDNEL